MRLVMMKEQERRTAMGILMTIVFFWLLFKFAGFLLRICGHIIGAIFTLVFYTIVIGVALTFLGVVGIGIPLVIILGIGSAMASIAAH